VDLPLTCFDHLNFGYSNLFRISSFGFGCGYAALRPLRLGGENPVLDKRDVNTRPDTYWAARKSFPVRFLVGSLISKCQAKALSPI